MIRIICAKCKNAYLQKADGNLTCPSCEAVFPEKDENLLSGIQYFNEGECESAKDCLMKYIVQEGAEPRAMFIKALCDSAEYDEDTYSLKGLYEKLTESLSDISDEWFVEYLAMANDEAAKIEKDVAEKHIALLEDADAEKIKKEVTTIITLQNDAKDFRKKLTDFAYEYNNRSENTISVRFSECFLVEPEIADEVGNRKYEKIINNIASHTVFTGSLSTDIKNLEIYYRCIVMFFRKNRQKYDFLMASAEKFSELSKRLEEGQYHTIKGTSTIGDKLKSAAYDFFQESLKDHDEDEENLQKETVVVHEPEIIEIPAEPEAEDEASEPQEFEDISSSSVAEDAEATEENDSTAEDDATVELIDISSGAEDEDATEEAIEENEDTVEEDPEAEDETSEVTEDAVSEEEEENTVEAEDEAEVPEDEESEETVEAVSQSAPSVTATLTKIDKTKVDVIPDDEKEAEENEETEETAQEEPVEEKPVRKHKKHYAPFVAILLIIIGIGAIIAIRVIPPKLKADKYDKAVAYVQQEQYDKAAKLFKELGNYEDSQELYLKNTYAYASQLETNGRYAEAKDVYATLGDYKDSALKVKSCIYYDSVNKLNEGLYDDAKAGFDSIADYEDSATQSQKCLYKKAEGLIANHNFTEGVAILETITSYDESVNDMILDAQYRYVKDHLDPNDETTQIYIINLVSANYLDSVALGEYLSSGQNVTPPEGGDDTPVTDDTPVDGTVVIYTNTSKTDLETQTTEFDSDRAIYIHVDCLDESLYGQQLTMSYENTYSHANLKTKVFTAEESSYVFTYGGDGTRNYDITFILKDASGNVIAEHSVSVN